MIELRILVVVRAHCLGFCSDLETMREKIKRIALKQISNGPAERGVGKPEIKPNSLTIKPIIIKNAMLKPTEKTTVSIFGKFRRIMFKIRKPGIKVK